jgi:hypothetical protein
MDIDKIIAPNLRALGEPCDRDTVTWWSEEISIILDREVKADVLRAAWRRVRGDIDSARREGRFAPKPLPETICEAYHACAPPPDLTGCSECSRGEVYRTDDQGYEYVAPCPHCEAGAFRRWQASRRSR